MTIYDIVLLGVLANFVANVLSAALLTAIAINCSNHVTQYVTTDKLSEYITTKPSWSYLYFLVPFVSIITLAYKLHFAIKCNFDYAEYAEQLIKLDKQLTFKDN